MHKKTLDRVVEAMRVCEQAPGLSVLQHGIMVADHYQDLVGHLRDGQPLSLSWRLPDWIHDPVLLKEVPDDARMRRYHVFHDCGKPYCLEVDGEGRRHFPDHAEVSRQIWLETGGAPEIAELIAQDMDIHLLKAAGVPEFATRPHAAGLLLTGLAEVHANASMFGGIEAPNFKMKWKNLDRRGRALVKAWRQGERQCDNMRDR